MGCDAYLREYLEVETNQAVICWDTDIFGVDQVWFPDSIYVEIDRENAEECKEVENAFMEDLAEERVVWLRNSVLPMKDIYLQALREMKIDIKDVVEIRHGADVWRRD